MLPYRCNPIRNCDTEPQENRHRRPWLSRSSANIGAVQISFLLHFLGRIVYPATCFRRTACSTGSRRKACNRRHALHIRRLSGLLVCVVATIVTVQATETAAAEPRAAAWGREPKTSAASFRPSETSLGPAERAARDRRGADSGGRASPRSSRENGNPLASIFDAETFSTQLSEDFRDPLGHFDPGVGGQMAQAMKQEAQREGEEDAEEHHGLLGRRFHGRGPVRFEYLYTGELMTNARGGRSTRNATQYEGLFNLGLDLRLDQMPVRLPGRFFMIFQHTHGRGITDDYVGDIQYVSSIDPSVNINQVSEYWWECSLFDGRATVRLGKQDSNAEFHLIEQAAEFLHASHGLPLSLPGPTYPHNGAAAVVTWRLTESWTAKAGVWDGMPNGATWGFSGTGAVFAAAELEKKYSLFQGRSPGEFDIGYGYLTSPSDDEETASFSEQHAFYIDWGQTITREDYCDETNDQGLFAFFRWGTSWPRENVLIKDFIGAGLIYKGLLPRRNDDRLGIGVNHVRHNLGGTGQETAIELFYKAHITEWSTIQPDLQYVFSPSGIYRDSVVVGLRYQVVF